jgi:DNA polymerase (family 10)
MGRPVGGRPVTNVQIARKLLTYAHELERAKENLYRIRAFRRAAEAVLRLNEPVEAVVARGGPAALAAVPGIGPSLATTLAGYATLGVWVTRTQPTTKRV